MRVLIVGCGYVGLPLGAELARLGHEVFGLRRSALAEAELKAAGITPIHADITQPDSLKNVPRDFDWVVNCAASGGGGAEDYRQVYLEGNRNLIAHFAGDVFHPLSPKEGADWDVNSSSPSFHIEPLNLADGAAGSGTGVPPVSFGSIWKLGLEEFTSQSAPSLGESG